MYISRVSQYDPNLQYKKTLPNFKGSLNKNILNHGSTANSSLVRTKSFLNNVIDFFSTRLKTSKKLKQTKEYDTPIKNIKPSEAEIRKLFNIPKNGMIVRNGYEEHYIDGKIVKKILCPEAYTEHTRLVDTQIKYIYEGNELKEIHKYDTLNGVEFMSTRVYTNLGDLSVAQIRDL